MSKRSLDQGISQAPVGPCEGEWDYPWLRWWEKDCTGLGRDVGSSEPGRPMVWSRDLLGTPGLPLSAEAHFPACPSAPLGTAPFSHRDPSVPSP